MPIYEYECNACGHEFEVMQKITDRPIRKCERCGRLKAKRRISRTSFVLKGSGWYVTDYAGKKPNGNGKHPKEDKPSSGKDETASSSSEKPSSPAGAAKEASA